MPENTNKEATDRATIHMRYSFKILNRRIVEKIKIVFFLMSFWGVAKLETYERCFVMN
jgi:hypothetical protein